MSHSSLPRLPFHHSGIARTALSLGVVGGAIAGTLAAGKNYALYQEGNIDKDEAVSSSLRAALKGGLAGSAGGAAAAAFGSTRATKLLAFAAGAAALSYLVAVKKPQLLSAASLPEKGE